MTHISKDNGIEGLGMMTLGIMLEKEGRRILDRYGAEGAGQIMARADGMADELRRTAERRGVDMAVARVLTIAQVAKDSGTPGGVESALLVAEVLADQRRDLTEDAERDRALDMCVSTIVAPEIPEVICALLLAEAGSYLKEVAGGE